MKSSALTFMLSLSLFALAQAEQQNQTNDNAKSDLIKLGNKMVTREHIRETMGRVKYNRTGGIVRKDGSAKGQFVLINAQKDIPRSVIADALATIDRQVKIQVKIVDVENIKIGSIGEEIAIANGGGGVAVVADAELPAIIAAPEDGWGIVNVARLKDSDESKFYSRTRKEILRAFALAAGAMYAAQGDFVLQPVRKPTDLDNLQREEFGAIILNIFPLSLPYLGITPWQQATYVKACEQGWAPAPTNEVQQAIWDKVHEMPSEPIKIKYKKPDSATSPRK